MSKCAGNAVWGLSSNFIFCDNSSSTAVFFYNQRRRLGLVPMFQHGQNCWDLSFGANSICRSDSIPWRTFLCFNPFSFPTISAFPSQHHFGTWWCAVLGLQSLCPSVFRAIECFHYEGLHLLVWICPCVFSSLFGKGAMFLPHIQYSGRHKESYTQPISAFHQAARDTCV